DAAGGRVPDALFLFPVDVLDDDDRIVGDQPERGRDPSERHEVDGLAGRSQEEQNDRDGDGNRGDGDERQPQAAQEDQEDDPRQRHPDQDRVADAADGPGDEGGLVVEIRPGDVARDDLRFFAEDLRDTLRDLDGVGGRLTDQVEQDGRPPARGRPDLGDGVAGGYRPEVPDTRRDSAAGNWNRDSGQGVRARNAPVHEREVELVVGLGQPRRKDLIVLLDRRDDVGRREPPGGESLRVQADLELALAPALNLDLGDAGDPDELGLQRVFGEHAQL